MTQAEQIDALYHKFRAILTHKERVLLATVSGVLRLPRAHKGTIDGKRYSRSTLA